MASDLSSAVPALRGQGVSTKPHPDEVTVRFSLEELDREFLGAKDKNVNQFIDPSVMKSIDQSGFIDKLYK